MLSWKKRVCLFSFVWSYLSAWIWFSSTNLIIIDCFWLLCEKSWFHPLHLRILLASEFKHVEECQEDFEQEVRWFPLLLSAPVGGVITSPPSLSSGLSSAASTCQLVACLHHIVFQEEEEEEEEEEGGWLCDSGQLASFLSSSSSSSFFSCLTCCSRAEPTASPLSGSILIIWICGYEFTSWLFSVSLLTDCCSDRHSGVNLTDCFLKAVLMLSNSVWTNCV